MIGIAFLNLLYSSILFTDLFVHLKFEVIPMGAQPDPLYFYHQFCMKEWLLFDNVFIAHLWEEVSFIASVVALENSF